jgi:hypothetical protein
VNLTLGLNSKEKKKDIEKRYTNKRTIKSVA